MNDIIIGAPQDSLGTLFNQRFGSAFIFSGSDISQTANIVANNAALIVQSEQVNSKVGDHVSFASDVNNGGHSDIIIGAPGHDGIMNNPGRVEIFYTEVVGLTGTILFSAAQRVHDGEYSGVEMGQNFYFGENILAHDEGLLIGRWQDIHSPNIPGSVLLMTEF